MTERVSKGDGRLKPRGRRAAAQLVVNADREVGRKTPQWIINLAEGKSYIGEELAGDGSNGEHLTPEGKQILAQLRVEGDQMRGTQTPQWIINLAEGKNLKNKAEAQSL